MIKYEEAYRIAREFWENPIVLKCWRNPIKLIEEMNWNLIPYTNQTPLGEAYSTYKNGEFFILCNTSTHFNRITYNLHHEVGHVVGGHPVRYKNIIYQSCINWEKKKLEIEATIIGRNIFLPAPILVYLKMMYGEIKTKKYLQYAYYLSSEYVDARMANLAEDFKNMGLKISFFQDDLHFEFQNMSEFLEKGFCYCFGGGYDFLISYEESSTNMKNEFNFFLDFL